MIEKQVRQVNRQVTKNKIQSFTSKKRCSYKQKNENFNYTVILFLMSKIDFKNYYAVVEKSTLIHL